ASPLAGVLGLREHPQVPACARRARVVFPDGARGPLCPHPAGLRSARV
ncbi:MAG: hypothetical protein AVDCRST_MAG01-01-1595, partial [uncultured Rubrobacteraceae bacterium]